MIRSVVVIFALAFTLSPLPVAAQDTPTSVARAELDLLTDFQSLERLTGQMAQVLVYAILAQQGGWKVFSDEIGNDYAIGSTANSAHNEAASAFARIRDNATVTEAEMAYAQTVLDNLDILIAVSREISDMIMARDYEAAALLYRDAGQEALTLALRSSRAAMFTVERRLGRRLDALE